jgi:superfamily II DNA helicase RecQ
MTDLMDVYRGSKNKNVVEKMHHQISAYGSGAHHVHHPNTIRLNQRHVTQQARARTRSGPRP